MEENPSIKPHSNVTSSTHLIETKEPEVDTTPTQEPQDAQKPSKSGPMRSWPWEILSLVFALALLIATIAIPAHYDQKVLKQWPYDINLNTVIAILSTFMRAAMMLVVAELVGQMGWQALREPRPITDIHHFDNGSRSMVGAFKLLWSVPPRLLSIVAAIVIILSPAIGPFTQQAVTNVPCPRTVLGASASLPISHYVPRPGSTYQLSSGVSSLKGDMKAAMINGLINPTGKDSNITARCPTGNCTFPATSSGVTHSSIAMCSSCLDVMEFVTLDKSPIGR
ncbi:hypothetical protein FSARC_9657 [Fusarium sarcochroum]|uniref:Uncharacterized protein n=1 Tax=Fusarium sarcochroum TaxID=1208366 RepID=A0A8H4X551_9HYPO|nr:hypothetical protein FSARC_9657 [Fusarium sarcochroum]